MAEPKFKGFLEGIKPTDYIAGQASGITYEERLGDGQWDLLIPSDERQYKKGLDVYGCVSFSNLNVIETQIKLLTGKTVNYSDRFLAKMSETTKDGNYAWKVADTVRKIGLVEESEWGWDEDIVTWDTYYTKIPDKIVEKGKEFLDEYDVQFEWVTVQNPFGGSPTFADPETIKYHLKHAPLQIGVPICSPWNISEVNAGCELTRSQHAIMLYGYNDEERYYKVLDHYEPFQKKLSYDYPIPWVFKQIITQKSNKNMEFLEQHQDYLVQDVQGTGAFGIIIDKEIRVAKKDRVPELLATYIMRGSKGTYPLAKNMWDELPKVKF